MLTTKQIERIKIKLVREKLNQSKLARIIRCSNGALTRMFNREKGFPNIEKRVLDWLNENSKDVAHG